MQSLFQYRIPSSRLLLLCALLLAAACGSPEGEVRSLRIGNSAEPATLDPHRAEGVPARNIQRDLFEGLLRETADGGYEPGVAESWSVSSDGLEYRFLLRPDARWSNGDPVTAADFVFSFRRAADPATGGIVAETLYPIRNAKAVISGRKPVEELGVSSEGDRLLRIRLEAPTAYFPYLLTHPSTFPVHPPSVGDDERWTRPGRLISNGAYSLQDWRVQAAITLVANPHYWEADKVEVRRVQYLPIEDANAELARFAAGELDITYGVPPGRIDRLREQYPRELRISPWFGTYYLGINVNRPPLDDVRLRRALALAIDRSVLAQDVLGAGESPAYHWIPPLPGYASPIPEWAHWSVQQRIEHARELIAAVGGETLPSIEILYNNRDRDQRIVAAIASMWQENLGLQTRLRNEEWKVYMQSRRQLATTEIFRSGWIGDYPDPHAFAEILSSSHGMNDTGWNNPDYDRLLQQASITVDASKRNHLLRSAEAIVLQELPIIPLYHYSKARLVSERVRGYNAHPLDHHYSRRYRWSD